MGLIHSMVTLSLSLWVNFISGPVLVMVLEKENAIADWRALIGPTDAHKAKITHPHRYVLILICVFVPVFLCLSRSCLTNIWSIGTLSYSIRILEWTSKCHDFIGYIVLCWFLIISSAFISSIRAMCGLDSEKNCVHGSDSTQSAQREILFFFKDVFAGKITFSFFQSIWKDIYSFYTGWNYTLPLEIWCIFNCHLSNTQCDEMKGSVP